jgi:hypothetical protein
MFRFLKELFTENIGMKLLALVLALMAWFYIVKALNQGSQEDMTLLSKIMPAESIAAKKLIIKPVFIGKPRTGYGIAGDKIRVSPAYCIVVGSKDVLGRIKFAYTVPIIVTGVDKPFTKAVPLNPIAPGVYMEETLVEVSVPVERMQQ